MKSPTANAYFNRLGEEAKAGVVLTPYGEAIVVSPRFERLTKKVDCSVCGEPLLVSERETDGAHFFCRRLK